MTFAWYGHLKHPQASPWWAAAIVGLFLLGAAYFIFR